MGVSAAPPYIGGITVWMTGNAMLRINCLILAAALGISAAGAASAASTGNVPSSSNPDQKFDQRNVRIRPVDCHRDVRTHRIGGVKVRHRHVGDNCQIRQVRKVN